jgi:hypothetical protein
MNKPDWNDAPSHANWMAKDESGVWCWFVKEPYLGDFHWMPSTDQVDGDSFGEFDAWFENDDFWVGTLEPRP